MTTNDTYSSLSRERSQHNKLTRQKQFRPARKELFDDIHSEMSGKFLIRKSNKLNKEET